MRYFGPRDLIEDGSVESDFPTVVDAQVGDRFRENWSAAAQVFNLFDSGESDIDYFYTSQLRSEAAEGFDDDRFHPADPRRFRLTGTARF